MADLMTNEIVEQATQAMENAGLDVTVIPEVAAKKFDLKSAICGTVVGAAGAVLVRKAVEAIKANKAEITEETNKVKAEKIRKKMEKFGKKLQELEPVDDDEDLDDENFDEEDIEE